MSYTYACSHAKVILMNGLFDFYQWLHTKRRRRTGFFFRAHSRITTKARGDLKIEILALQVTFKHRGHADCGFFNKFLNSS